MGHSKIGSGDFADVFDLGDGTVVKAFRRLQHTGGDVAEWRDEDALTTQLFEAEVRAYERLRRLPDLAVFTPEFFGEIDPYENVDLKESEQYSYVRGCGIRLERILGTDIKFAFLDQQLKEEVHVILERFGTSFWIALISWKNNERSRISKESSCVSSTVCDWIARLKHILLRSHRPPSVREISNCRRLDNPQSRSRFAPEHRCQHLSRSGDFLHTSP